MFTGVSSRRSDLNVHRVADRYRSEFAVGFRNSVTALRRRATDQMLDHAIDNWGAHGELVALLGELRVTKASLAIDSAADVFAQIVSAVALDIAPDELAAMLTITSPTVARRAQTMAANLVTNVTAESKQAIRSAIHQSVMGQLDREETRSLIRDVIGLSDQQGRALANYAVGLYQADNPKADSLISDYSDRLLAQRADTIARTETMQAANYGQQDAWSEMADAGYIDRASFVQEWLVTDDDRLCDECAPMDGQQIGLDGTFESTEKGVLPSDRVAYAGDSVDSPPLHPNCRCTLVASV